MEKEMSIYTIHTTYFYFVLLIYLRILYFILCFYFTAVQPIALF